MLLYILVLVNVKFYHYVNIVHVVLIFSSCKKLWQQNCFMNICRRGTDKRGSMLEVNNLNICGNTQTKCFAGFVQPCLRTSFL